MQKLNHLYFKIFNEIIKEKHKNILSNYINMRKANTAMVINYFVMFEYFIVITVTIFVYFKVSFFTYNEYAENLIIFVNNMQPRKP